MIYQDSDSASRSRLYEERKRSLEVEKVLCGQREMQKSFARMLRVKAHVTLQEQWVNEDRARFNAWLDREHFPYVFDYKSIPFDEWLVEKTRGQFFAPTTIKVRPQKIDKTAEEEPRPPAVSVETKSVVGLEERVQISESEIDLENGSLEECSNDEQDQFIVLAEQTTPIDMIIGDTADMEKSRSVKLFELKAEVMLGGHNNCSTYSAAENEKYFSKTEIFGENSLFGLERNQVENFNINISRLGIKHRWPPPIWFGLFSFHLLNYFLNHSVSRPMHKKLRGA